MKTRKFIVFLDFQKAFLRVITGLLQGSITAEATLSNYLSQHQKIKWAEWQFGSANKLLEVPMAMANCKQFHEPRIPWEMIIAL